MHSSPPQEAGHSAKLFVKHSIFFFDKKRIPQKTVEIYTINSRQFTHQTLRSSLMAAKYKELADTLRSNIGKTLVPGDKLPTQRELMDTYGVSYATIERALRILSDVQLISCHVGRGTFVNNIKKTSGSGNVCVISSLPGQTVASNWHQDPIFEGIRNVLDDAGFRLMLSDYGSIEDVSHYSGFAGLIFIAPKEDNKKFVAKFQHIGMPSVIISTSWKDVAIPSIDCDNEYGIRCALRYLAGRSHTRIGYVDQDFPVI